jgi:hypothetical protein
MEVSVLERFNADAACNIPMAELHGGIVNVSRKLESVGLPLTKLVPQVEQEHRTLQMDSKLLLFVLMRTVSLNFGILRIVVLTSMGFSEVTFDSVGSPYNHISPRIW